MSTLPFRRFGAMLVGSPEGLTMRLGIALAISLACVAALTPAPVGATVSWPARALATPDPDITRIQGSGSTKIRKECEVKADKQKLRGLSREAYVERCMEALSFNTIYGTNSGTR